MVCDTSSNKYNSNQLQFIGLKMSKLLNFKFIRFYNLNKKNEYYNK